MSLDSIFSGQALKNQKDGSFGLKACGPGALAAPLEPRTLLNRQPQPCLSPAQQLSVGRLEGLELWLPVHGSWLGLCRRGGSAPKGLG